MNKANAVYGLGDMRSAATLYDQAIAIRERLINEEGGRELANDLAMAYMNKAIAVCDFREHRQPDSVSSGIGSKYRTISNSPLSSAPR